MEDESREPRPLPTADLREQTAALLMGVSKTTDVIALASDLLAEGHAGQPLIELASLSASATSADVVDLSSATLTEAGDPPLEQDGEEIPLLGLRVACRRFLNGELDLRAFSSWAHDSIGHDGPNAAQPLVEIDDVLDDLDWSQGTRGRRRHRGAELDPRRQVAQLASAYLASTAQRRKATGSSSVHSPIGDWTPWRRARVVCTTVASIHHERGLRSWGRVPYGDGVDMGRVILGGSTVAALVLAVGFGIVATSGGGLSTGVLGGGVCGTYPKDEPSGAAWFASSFQNDTGRSVTVRSVRAANLHDVIVSHLSVAVDPETDGPDLFVTNDPTMPSQYGQTVPADGDVAVPAHGKLVVVGRIRLIENADAGRLEGVVVTTNGPFGTLHTVEDPSSFGIRVGQDHSLAEIGCTNTHSP